MHKWTFREIWIEIVLTIKMIAWIMIFLSIFIPQSVDFWLPI